jgi:dienelactone hydrolase
VDPDRLVVWVFSGGGWMMAPFLRERPVYVRALVAFYAVLDVPADDSMPEDVKLKMVRFSSRAEAPFQGRGCCAAPVFIARAGLDGPALNQSIERFVQEARKEANYIDVTLMEHPEGRHGFDILDDNDRSREIIQGAISFLKKNLGIQVVEGR